MDPVLKAVLLSWDWRPEVIVVLLTFGALYTVGWRRLRRRARGRAQLASGWRLASYLTGLVFIGISLLSPIDTMAQQLFLMHMIQHLLLIMIAPPLLLLANPMPFVLWGLPDRARRSVGGVLSSLLHRESASRRWLRAATGPGIIWMVWTVALIGWHDPGMYNAALRSELVHDLEHVSFFLASMLLWWHVVGAGPRIHKQFGLLGRIAFVLSVIPVNMALGVVLAFAGFTIYTYYLGVPRLWGIDPVTDQRVGGIIMWIPGSMMYIIAALILIARLLQGEGSKPALPEKRWATSDTLTAPGIEK